MTPPMTTELTLRDTIISTYSVSRESYHPYDLHCPARLLGQIGTVGIVAAVHYLSKFQLC